MNFAQNLTHEMKVSFSLQKITKYCSLWITKCGQEVLFVIFLAAHKIFLEQEKSKARKYGHLSEFEDSYLNFVSRRIFLIRLINNPE